MLILSKRSLRKIQHCPRSLFLASHKHKPIKFQKQNTGHETSSFVAIDKRMISHNSGGVNGGQLNDAVRIGVEEMLPRSGQGRFEKI